jgi:hypothetical protein
MSNGYQQVSRDTAVAERGAVPDHPVDGYNLQVAPVKRLPRRVSIKVLAILPSLSKRLTLAASIRGIYLIPAVTVGTRSRQHS